MQLGQEAGLHPGSVNPCLGTFHAKPTAEAAHTAIVAEEAEHVEDGEGKGSSRGSGLKIFFSKNRILWIHILLMIKFFLNIKLGSKIQSAS